MQSLFRAIGTIGLAAGLVSPACASVSLAIDGTFLRGSDAVNQAIGGAPINPRFSAGLLLTIDASPLSASYTMSQKMAYTLSPGGVINGGQKWWGYAINQYDLASESYGIVFDHDRSDAEDPTYPLWSLSSGNTLLILFDWGVVPSSLRFDVTGLFEQHRHATFRGVSTGTRQPFPDEENIASSLAPSSMENGTIGCSSSAGRETLIASDPGGFQPTTHSSQVSTRCSISIDVARFLADGPPPVTDPVAAVPEPATWAMMICGFLLVGAAMRRRSPLHA